MPVPPGSGPPQSTSPADPTIVRLADVLPAVSRALGVPGPSGRLLLPVVNRAVVVLVDGLGDLLLAERASYAPFLASLREGAPVAEAGFPTTTATSMGSFGTGLPPGAHGLVGYEVRDPDSGLVVNQLSWQNGPDPIVWQPNPTLFEQVVAAGVDAVQIGPAFFEGSGLTTAALRGPRFVAARSLSDRVEAAAAEIRRAPRSLVYVYWGEVDKVGHEQGVGSSPWLEELQAVDLAVRMLAARLPPGTLLLVTADHGMVDVPFAARIDLADPTPVSRALRRDVEVFAGEPRAPALHVRPGTEVEVRDRWRSVLGPDADVQLRDDAVDLGWYGPVSPRVQRRLGDVVVMMTGLRGIHDSRTQRHQLTRLIGLHGSRTPAESRIPVLVHLTE